MHDTYGRLIEVGDHLKVKAWVANIERWTIGRVSSVHPGSETCNVNVVHLVPGYHPVQVWMATARDTELVLKADGSEPVSVLQELTADGADPLPEIPDPSRELG